MVFLFVCIFLLGQLGEDCNFLFYFFKLTNV